MSLYLSMPMWDVFGAGTCGKYLLREFAKRGKVYCDPAPIADSLLDAEAKNEIYPHLLPLKGDAGMPLIQFTGPNLEPQCASRGNPTVGYVFFEKDSVNQQQRENLAKFDILIGGSEWQARMIYNAGFDCVPVQQGVDREIFRPMERFALKDKFVIYSGGKWEHRKAQDLVVRTVKVLQERHDDILLMSSWFHIWDGSDHRDEAAKAGVKMIYLPLCSHKELAAHMNQTDIGLFPNRCEGGTNLMLMDYLACGKPVVANISTGQDDVCEPTYAFCIEGDDDALVEQMIESVECAYRSKTVRAAMGSSADKAMNQWPWTRTADGIEKAIQKETAGARCNA